MTLFEAKFREVIVAILPITVIVLVLNFTLVHLDLHTMLQFLIGVIFIMIGLSAFLMGVDMSISPIGHLIGSSLVKKNKIWLLIAVGLVLGFIISITEPDLHILAGQVELVTSGMISKSSILIVVSVGIAIMIALGFMRIVLNIPLYLILIGLYAVILVLAFFTSREFLAISFDSSGATTGAMTVPFILALGLGVSKLKKDSKASEKDSFGLIAIASTGAIIAVMLMSLFSKVEEITGTITYDTKATGSLMNPFLQKLPEISLEILIALLPILILFVVLQKLLFRLSRHELRKIILGLLFTFVGLILFLTGVNAGFMEVGNLVGFHIATLNHKAILIAIGFILGFATILAEPAVHVLTHQIEDVTSGFINRKLILAAMSIGVGVAVALSLLRIVIPALQLWHLLLPGYLIAIAMTLVTPKVFVGIAFDSGGVASGPMTVTFILAFAQGAAQAIEGANVLVDGFGIIAMVALTPIIALQALGLVYKGKTVKQGVEKDAV